MRYWELETQQAAPLITVDTTDGDEVIALPPAGLASSTGQTNQNRELTYRKTSPDVNTVKITGSPDGDQILTSNGGAASRVRFKSDATDWWVVG
jgi:hypothetical protein